MEDILNLENYSRLSRVLRITAWVNRFTHNARSKDRKRGKLSATEMEIAERYWIKVAQNRCFPKEVKQLTSGQNVEGQSRISNLNPFIDEHGLLRVGGRLQKANMTFAQRHPCILSDNHTFTELQIKRAHTDVMHCGLQDTLTQVRQQFWILKGR